ncbi:hypothetical protein, partial [Bacillus sp. WP8]|uniref:hypothetical protein n=1 Tax=Bacillus sp. WP8 TaxID=756828 RepID=UPI001C9314B7
NATSPHIPYLKKQKEPSPFTKQNPPSPIKPTPASQASPPLKPKSSTSNKQKTTTKPSSLQRNTLFLTQLLSYFPHHQQTQQKTQN